MKIIFPAAFQHKHPPIKNLNEILDEKLTLGQKFADRVSNIVGSWKFIIIQSFILILWVIVNVISVYYRWDPYPFILMNLLLSLQAAYTAPIIMMSQNRFVEKDRIEAHIDYQINIKAEEEIRLILENLYSQNEALTKIIEVITQKE
jgi:uncharacterized membrane protein